MTKARFEEALSAKSVKQLLSIDAETFFVGLHMKVSGYLRLYSSFINVGRKFILAHNQFVSIFNLSTNQWTSHKKFSDTVRQIFRNRKVKRILTDCCTSHQPYDIGVLVGSSTFRFFEPHAQGEISLSEDQIVQL